MPNPYVILGIPQSATDSDIRKALKEKIEIFCGPDCNAKDANGNYFFQMYNDAAQLLLNPISRKEIDRVLDSDKFEIVQYNGKKEHHSVKQNVKSDEALNDFISSINVSKIIEENDKSFKIDENRFYTNFEASNLYGLLGEDGSFNFCYEKSCYDFLIITKRYFLRSAICSQDITKKYFSNNRPWINGVPFVAGGVKSLAIYASKILPLNLLYEATNDKVTRILTSDLVLVENAVNIAIKNNPEKVKQIFRRY